MDASNSLVEQAMQSHQAGDLARAAALYEAHLGQHPSDANVTHLLGALRHQSGEHRRAVDLIRRAIELDASKWTWFGNLGAALRAVGRIDEAVAAFGRAHRLCPDQPEPLNNLGAAWLEQGNRGEARRCFEAALTLAPGHVEAQLNLGQLCRKEGNLDEAIACYTRALQYDPESIAALQQRADVQFQRRRLGEALTDYQHVIDRQPGAIEAHLGKCQTQLIECQFDNAQRTIEDALRWEPRSAAAHCALAEVLLGRRQWTRGWSRYEWRFRKNGGPARRDFGVPEWQGEPLDGQRLLVYGEQTPADEVMFSRAMAAVLPEVGHCLIECDAALVGLFQRSLAGATVHQRDVSDTSWTSEAGGADYQIAAGSLLGRLLMDEPALLDQGAYLTPDAGAVAKWRQRLATLDAGGNVGIAWQSRSGELSVGRRLSEWTRLLQTPGVNWVNLQAGEVDTALAECFAHSGVEIHDWEDADPLGDVDTLAAQMAALDLVICTDGLTAQLAAACGTSAWVLLGDQPNWRWGYQHDQVEQRGTIRLFRPEVPDEGRDTFAGLIAAVADELKRDAPQTSDSFVKTPVAEDVDTAEREEAVRLKKRHPTIDDDRSGLVGVSVDEAIGRATCLHETKEDLDLAEHICRVVLDEVPHRAKALHRLGALLVTMRRADEAVPLLQQATALRPLVPLNHYQLAAALTELNRHDDAIEPLRRAITLKPNFAEAYINLGAVLERCGRLDDAEPVCRRAVEMNSRNASALYNLGNVILHLGKVEEAQRVYDRVVEVDPQFPKGHWNRGLAYLVDGNYAEGWPEYEWREAADEVVIDKYDAPLWDGKSSLEGKFILLHAEQGIGDELMFATCYRDIIREAGRVMITCDPRLKVLMQRSFPEAAVVALRRALGDKLNTPASLDCHIPVGSLPLHLRSRWEEFPGTPYLQADPDQLAEWRERFDALGPELKIGISWRAGGVASEQRRRTSPLDHWEPIFRLPGLQFVNLQYGKCADDIGRAQEQFGTTIHHWDDANPLKDLDAAAAQIAALDMVVSVGNTTIHMAGALGKETWIALPHVPGWRYLIRGEQMPWYGSARLLRQAADRDWRKLLERIASELDAHLGLSSGTRPSQPLVVAWDAEQRSAPSNEVGAAEPVVPGDDVAADTNVVTDEDVVTDEEINATIQQAVAAHQSGDLATAERMYRDVLASRPDCLNALYLLGTLASQTGQAVEAVGLLRRALDGDASRPEIHYNFANALRRAGDRQQAARHYRCAIELAPEFALAHLNLGATLDELEDSDEALSCFERAAELAPDMAEAHHNRGSVLVGTNRLEEAATAYRAALRINPDYAEAHAHLGGVLRALGRLEEAKTSYEASLRLRPDDADTRVNRAMLLLQQGEFDQGWQEYEWRWGAADGPRPRATTRPTWQGESLVGKTLLVWGEQGVGDELMFASCVAEVAAGAEHCVVECSPRLAGLFARSLPGLSVVAAGGTVPGTPSVVDLHADVQIAAGSLPRLIRGSIESFPQRESFLVADPQRCQQWRQRFDRLGHGLKVGISWRSGSDGPDCGQRTIDLTLWRDLIATSGTHFVSLQYGDVESDIAVFERTTGLTIHRWNETDGSGEFDDLAAEIASLDLVISVANATVHLAGGLGVDTWTLTPMAPSWRWLEGKSTSPWYPRMSVYSQASRGDWPGVLADVQLRLVQRLVEDGRSSPASSLSSSPSSHPPIAAPHLGLRHLPGVTEQLDQTAR